MQVIFRNTFLNNSLPAADKSIDWKDSLGTRETNN
jgi:hypothetical protein